ncbi:ATP-binding cassette domain-containing protein, partial [Mycoplasmopsis bovis]|uniref:ATP-binding cassette domain-containing protein n=1 Tax=Mycoplasmopsis bovis TaxID=28903 RepID=UPI003D2E6D28
HNYAVEFEHVTKDFVGIRANDDVTFKVKKGTIHALIGENGAGKSTLTSILFGLYEPTEGSVKINGKSVIVKNPNQANEISIGSNQFKVLVNHTYSNFISLI